MLERPSGLLLILKSICNLVKSVAVQSHIFSAIMPKEAEFLEINGVTGQNVVRNTKWFSMRYAFNICGLESPALLQLSQFTVKRVC